MEFTVNNYNTDSTNAHPFIQMTEKPNTALRFKVIFTERSIPVAGAGGV